MKSKDLAKFLAESYGLQFLKPSTVSLSDESEFCTIQTPSAIFSRFDGFKDTLTSHHHQATSLHMALNGTTAAMGAAGRRTNL